MEAIWKTTRMIGLMCCVVLITAVSVDRAAGVDKSNVKGSDVPQGPDSPLNLVDAFSVDLPASSDVFGTALGAAADQGIAPVVGEARRTAMDTDDYIWDDGTSENSSDQPANDEDEDRRQDVRQEIPDAFKKCRDRITDDFLDLHVNLPERVCSSAAAPVRFPSTLTVPR